MSSDPGVAAPATTGPVTADALPPYVRSLAPAWPAVRAAEGRVREAWDAMARPPHPAGHPAGLAARLRLVAARAARLVEGPDSTVGRLARLHPARWDAAREPVAGVLRECAAVAAEADRLRALAGATRAVLDAYGALREEFERALPRTWARLVTDRGLTAAAVERAASDEELSNARRWLESARVELERRRVAVAEWLRAGADGTLDAAAAADAVPDAQLEERFYLLHAFGAADRAAQQRRTAERLRHHLRRHLEAVRPSSALWQLAVHYAETETSATLGSDELRAYADAIRLAGAPLHPAPPEAAVDEERAGRFATPIDEDTVVIRRGLVTPLAVLATESERDVLLAARMPSTATPLDRDEAARVGQYFAWERRESFWWRTKNPAAFTVERLRDDLLVGRRVRAGEVVSAEGGWDPRRRPPDAAHPFAVYLEPRRSYLDEPLRDPWGPEPERDRAGAERVAYESDALRAVLVRFPAFSAEVAWLWRPAPRFQNARHSDAVVRSAQLLRLLNERRPGSAAEVLHYGRMEAAAYAGTYAAARRPAAAELSELVGGGGASAGAGAMPNVAALVRDLAADLALTVAAAHDAGWCAGVLAPSLVRGRLAGVGGGLRARATVLALPLAGAPGEAAPGLERQFAAADLRALGRAPAGPYVRGVREDLAALGALLGHLMHAGRVEWPELRELSRRLLAGEVRDASAAARELASLVPAGEAPAESP